MSATASESLPYSTLCPWLTIITLQYGRMARLTIDHEGLTQSFEVDEKELSQQFASVFKRAMKLKYDMMTAAKVAKALSDE